MSDPSPHRLRITWVWSHSFLDLVVAGAEHAPLRGLGNESDYIGLFDRVRQRRGDGLELPWRADSRQLFWIFYLNKELDAVSGRVAWRNHLPFRRKPVLECSADVPGHLTAELFLYRHGIAAVVNMTVDRPQLEEAIDDAVRLRRESVWQGGARMRIDEVAARLLSMGHADILGRPLPAGYVAAAPWSIATLVRAEGIDPATPLQEGDDKHRRVDALARFDPLWRQVALRDLDASRLHTRQCPPGHALYGKGRARVVWFPAHSMSNVVRRQRLACYHRNLTFATMQTELLSGFLDAAQASRMSGASLPARVDDQLREVGGILGRLYVGKSTYSTWSARAQIDLDDARKATLNAVREYAGLARL